MYSKVLIKTLLLFFFLLVPTSYADNEGWKNRLPGNIGILIHKVAMSAKPSVVAVELFSPSRGIERFEATGYVLSSSGTEVELMLTALVDVTGVNKDELALYSFSATAPSGEVLYFPVKSITFAEIQAEAITAIEIEQRINKANQDLKLEERLAKAEVDRLEQLKSQALELSGVDDLVELNTELDGFNEAPVLSETELMRLNSLYQQGRMGSVDPQMSSAIPELNRQLFQVAKLTTKIDQAEQAKRTQHHTDINRRVMMIKESLSLNSEEIAREIVRLRARRRELEQKTADPSSVPPPSTDGEF